MEQVEERTIPVMRATEEAPTVQGEKLVGYAVVYNSLTAGPVGVGGVYLPEKILPGAFTDSLARNIPFVFDHKDYAEYGDTKSQTLRLTEDDKGIRFELSLPTYANVLRREVTQGLIRGMSFGFMVREMTVTDGIRSIIKADLTHIAPVYSPAYEASSIKLATRGLGTKKKKLQLLDKCGVDK